jgi:hypothetical protein
MAGYSGKPVVQKLGIQPGFCIFAIGAPAAYADIVGKLPAQVTVVTRLGLCDRRDVVGIEIRDPKS